MIDLNSRAAQDGDFEICSQGAYHIVAESSLTDERRCILKHGDTFAVFDHYGNITPAASGEEGLYYDGTRFLSRLTLALEGSRPFFLSSTVRDDNDQLTVALTNPEFCRGDHISMRMGTLYIRLRLLLWQAACYQELRIENHGLKDVETTLSFQFGADFADIYEVRGLKRKARGVDLPPDIAESEVALRYRGLDDVVRRTVLRFDPRPARLSADEALVNVSLRPKETAVFHVAVGCEIEPHPLWLLPFDTARIEAARDLEEKKAMSCRIEAPNGQFNAWVNRAVSDLHLMTTQLATGPYPYAGVPWFNAPYGRDGIITALECLWMRPHVAKGVLAYLASTQAQHSIPEQDAEPGKILHETRNGEMALLKEIPFARYYGTVDATPLFVALAGSYFERTGDRAFIEEIWPNIKAAMLWMVEHGDRDGDGFVEYQRQSQHGLVHQGWKDDDDAIFHSDGSPAVGPIALCEVQGYVYAAWQAGALLASVLGHPEEANLLTARAETLRHRFNEAFWCDELSAYALALDGEKRQCRIRTSNSGQCLFTGISNPEHAVQAAHTLLSPQSFSGWGIRTVSAGEARYNPMGYHTGSVWPHDNALIAYGFAKYGLKREALRLFTGMFQAAMYFDMQRMPELFCGFPLELGEGPVLYPVACSPQAWSAASVFLLFQACLGIDINGPNKRIALTRPSLPGFLTEVRIRNLEVAGATVDLLLVRNEHDVSVDVLDREGDLEVVVLK